MSLRGYCRTLNDRMDCKPAMRMTRLTTIDSTGRLTNRSVKRILAVLRFRRSLVGGLNLVVDGNRCTVAQLEDTGSHNFFAALHAGKNGDLIPTRRTDLHELLAHAAILLPFRIFQRSNNEHRVTIRRIAHRGRRHRDDSAA